MANIEEGGLYVASWEHLYLLLGGVPAGLPNQLFARHPWALILFEHLYCDENGFLGEQTAAEQMKWTNSELFVRLASPKYDIIKPINLSTPLQPHILDVKRRFKKKHGSPIEKAIKTDSVSVEELFQWRLELLKPFLDEHHLILYDWPIARYGQSIPVALRKAVSDVLGLEVAAVPLARDITSELSEERKRIFVSLQEFEREPLRHLRSGRLSQPDYLKILKRRTGDYREVDMELQRGIERRIDRVLRLRGRFGKRGGWQLVRDFLKEYSRGAHPKELNEIDQELRDRLRNCFKPVLAEFGPATAKIAHASIYFLPYIGKAKKLADLRDPAKDLANLAREMVNFFRGEFRRSKS